MIRTRLKITAFVLLIISLLPGCSGVGRTTPTPEPATIRFSFIGNAKIYEALAQEFHELYPHLTVALEEITGFTNDIAQVESRADVNRVMSFLQQTDSYLNYLPLGNLLDLSQVLSTADFFPESLKALQVEGEQLGIPAGISQVVMFYSILRFKIAGIEAPPPNWDLTDFINLAASVQKQGKSSDASNDVVYGYCTSPFFDDPRYFTYLFGGQLFDRLPNPTRPTLNLPENVDAIKWYVSLRNEYQITQPEANDRQFYQDIFGYKCGFWMNVMELPVFMGMRKEDVGVLPLPNYKTRIDYASLDSYHIQKSSPHPLEAWQWIEFLVTHPISAGNLLPPLPKQLADQEFISRISPAEAAIINQLNENTIFLSLDFYQNPGIQQVVQIYNAAVRQVMYEQADVQTALDAAQAEAETIVLTRNSPFLGLRLPD